MTEIFDKYLERVAEVAEFCHAHRGRCFPGWTVEQIIVYVSFHATWGTVFLARDKSTRKVESVAFAWPTADERMVFNWRRAIEGDTLLIAEVIGNRKTVKRLFRLALRQWPKVRRFCTWRWGKLVELKRETILRFAYE
jgi:hypothetical protein